MRNIRASINIWIEQLEDRWLMLPRKAQSKIILCFFISYSLITVATIVQVCYEVQQSKAEIQIEHINSLPEKKVSITG